MGDDCVANGWIRWLRELYEVVGGVRLGENAFLVLGRRRGWWNLGWKGGSRIESRRTRLFERKDGYLRCELLDKWSWNL